MDNAIRNGFTSACQAERDESGRGVVAPGELPVWSSGDAADLAARLAAEGRGLREIGALWGVSADAVQKRLRRRKDLLARGEGGDASLPAWGTDAARDALLRLCAEGLDAAVIARRFGVTEVTIVKWLERLGQPEPKASPSAKIQAPDVVPAWNEPAALDVIRRLRGGGWSAAGIGGLFGVTKNAVLKRLKRDVERAARAPVMRRERRPSARQWSAEATERLLAMRAEGVPVKEIASALGVSRSAVRHRLLRLLAAGASFPAGREPEAASLDDVRAASATPSEARAGFRPGDGPDAAGPDRDAAVDAGPSGKTLAPVAEWPNPGCRWPLWGNDERPTHRYCGKPVVRTRWPGVYCEECRAKAFRRIAIVEPAAA